MQNSKIIKIFQNRLSPSIVSGAALRVYVDFCIDSQQKKYIKGETTKHHILPMAKTLPFREYANLNDNPWNCAILTYSDHYKAHYLLQLAVDHFSTSFAFCAMHNKDFKLGRISEDDMINEDEFTSIWIDRNKKIKESLMEVVYFNGERLTKAQVRGRARRKNLSDAHRKQMSDAAKEMNPIKYPGAFEKMRKTKIDRNSDKIGAQKAAETMKKVTYCKDGMPTTIYSETAKKISATRLAIQKDGRTLASHANEKTHAILRNKSKMYKLKNVFDDSYCEILPAYSIREMCANLETKTKEDYLGRTKIGVSMLKKRNAENLIGLYCERIQ